MFLLCETPSGNGWTAPPILLPHPSIRRDCVGDSKLRSYSKDTLLVHYLTRLNHDSSTTEWKGSTYSWTAPSTKSKRWRKQTNETCKPLITSIPFKHCDATIEIEEHPDELGLDSSPTADRTGVILWSAAYSLAEYFDVQFFQRRSSWSLSCQQQRRTCLELGAGLGLPSIVAAKHGWNCILTETHPDVLSLLQQNLERNNLHEGQQSESEPWIAIEALDWTSPEQAKGIAEKYACPDLIVLSDLVYAQTKPVWQDLLSVVNSIREESARKGEVLRGAHSSLERFDGSRSANSVDPLVLLGYTQRRRNLDIQGEREFFALVQEMGMEAVMIPIDAVPNSEKRLLTMLFELRWRN